jgi:hypothetical protein
VTPLLVVGVVLLALVIGLSVLQRSRQRDFASGPRAGPGAQPASPAARPSPPAPGDPSDDPDWPFRTDPYWGELMWDHESRWEADGAPPIGNDHVTVVLFAGREGPGAAHREWYEAARVRGDALVQEATRLIGADLAGRGLGHVDLSLDVVHIGNHAADVPFQGRLEFEADHARVEWSDVRSLDLWRTLDLDIEVMDPGDVEGDDEDA